MAHIFQINISSGGVPKLPLPRAKVTHLGINGDYQRDTKHHGGIERAICLYSLDLILALHAEGHPLFPGALGENLTIAGLSWSVITPGLVLNLGENVALELTSYTSPCSQITTYFKNGDYSRISQKSNPGWSRLYARVLQPGDIQIADPVTIS